MNPWPGRKSDLAFIIGGSLGLSDEVLGEGGLPALFFKNDVSSSDDARDLAGNNSIEASRSCE
jgi:hypothetical protein